MPTHFSKLEGSPSHRHRERNRRRKLATTATTTTTTTPASGFDEIISISISISSNATVHEGNSVRAGSSLRRNVSRDIPQFIHIQNWRCLEQTQQHEKQQQHPPKRTQDRHAQQQQQRQRERGVSDRSLHVHNNNNNETSNQGYHRPPRYDAYCESRVSAISSFPSHDEPGGSSRVSSLSSGPRSDGRAAKAFLEEAALRGGHPPSPSRRRDAFGSTQHTTKRPNENKHKTPPNHNHVVYDLASASPSVPSDPSTLTASTSGGRRRNPRSMHTLVNAHGVFGGSRNSNSNNNSNNNKHENMRDSLANEPLSSSRSNRAKSALQSVRHLEQSITDSYGDPYYSRSDPSSRRRDDLIIINNHDDEDPFESRDEASLWGERFADAYSESDDPPKDVLGLQHLPPNRSGNYSTRETTATDTGTDTAAGNDNDNDNDNGRKDNHRQQHHVATKWLCDVCKEARFDTYVEAYRHEIECRTFKNKTHGSSNIKEPKDSHHRGEVEAKLEISISSNNRTHNNNNNNNSNDGRSWRREHKGNQLQEMSLSSSADSRSSNHCRIDTTSNTPIALEGGGGGKSSVNNNPVASKDEATRWLCSVCKEVSFDHYPDACYHEKICKIRMEATADLRGSAATTVKPMAASNPIPLLNLTRDDAVCMIRTDATADLWEAADKLNGTSDPPSPLYHTQTLEDGNRYNHVAMDRPERRQEENDRERTEPQVRYETLDAIERERDRPMNPAITETRDDRCHAFDTNVQNVDNVFPRDSLFSSVSTRNHKGEAYDRYVSLASQQEEEEERERFIALAKQTREEELLSYKRGEKDDERYVCLA